MVIWSLAEDVGKHDQGRPGINSSGLEQGSRGVVNSIIDADLTHPE